MLEALLSDRNLKPQTAGQILEGLLRGWKDRGGRSNSLTFTQSFLFANAAPYWLSGPKVVGLPRNVRVARIVQTASLVPHLRFLWKLRKPDRRFLAPNRQLEELTRVANNNPERFALNSWGLNWVGLHDTVRSLNAAATADELGLIHLRPDDQLVAIEYDIPSRYLQIPTVIDGGLTPGFVAKPARDAEASRAWNWIEGRWGAQEFVHSSRAEISNISFRMLDGSPRQRLGELAAFQAIAPIQSRAIAKVVRGALSQVAAHEKLEPFMRGERSLLNVTPREFELFLGALYARLGFRTKVTRASRDGGIDVIAVSDEERRESVLIQAKKTGTTVGIGVVRELIGARFLAGSSFAKSMLVVATTGSFTGPAKHAEAEFPLEIELKDFNSLQQELRAIKRMGIRDISEKAVAAAWRRSNK